VLTTPTMADSRTFAELRKHYGEAPDLGHGVVLRWTATDGNVIGCIRDHPRPDDGRPCSSTAFFDVPTLPPDIRQKRPVHRVISWVPLTLEPSLLCRTCGSHGFVRNSRWEPA
jgi:hypothetical protein